MDWKEIETKWAAMARRICADARVGEINDGAAPKRPTARGDTSEKAVANRVVVVSTETNLERDTVSTH